MAVSPLLAPGLTTHTGEFELIARLSAAIRTSKRTAVGVGDDCAVLARPRAQVLFTIDSMVEGIHFELSWARPEVIGARALAVNLSDIAAMGGRPTACVVNLAVPKTAAMRTLDGLYAGLRRAAQKSGVDIVGGNVTRARELSITIAMLGEAAAGVMRRDAARAGDHIFVTGTLGDAALGWRLLASRLKARGAPRKYLVNRFLSPPNRVGAGLRLASIKPTPAAIDVSDGLVQDLGHILERSGVGAEIDASKIPLSPAYSRTMGGDLSHALGGGEDYELLFCLRAGRTESQLSRRLGVPVHRIGRIVRGHGLRMIGSDAPKVAGWDQLRTGARIAH